MIHFLRSLTVRRRLITLLVLCPPAFLINLHLAAFTGDEAIRALVAFEMDLSGNYVATTMHGAPYINKPPLFNWLVLIAFKWWGGVSEVPSRLVTLFFLGLFAFAFYRVARKEMGEERGILAAFTLLTSGRWLFYDAMLGLIDTTFSFVVYAGMMSLYFFGKRELWRAFFVAGYALMAIGFLLKGFPAIAFQGISLLVALAFFRRLRLLFSLHHALGLAVAALIIGGWLYWYAQHRPLDVLMENLLHESAKRTVISYSWARFFRHLYEFPYKQLYNFLPYSLFLIFLFDRHVWRRLMSPFVRFNVWLMLANLPLYWTSVHVEPRYLLMFVPLFNIAGLYLMWQHQREQSAHFRLLYNIWGILLIASAPACAGLPWVPALQDLDYVRWIGPIGALVLFLICIAYFADRQRFLWWFVAGLLVVRIVFDAVVLQARHDETITTRARRDAYALADKYAERNWYVYGDAYIREPASFYWTQRLGRIIPRATDTTLNNSVYIVNPGETNARPGLLVDSLQTDYTNIKLYLFLRE